MRVMWVRWVMWVYLLRPANVMWADLWIHGRLRRWLTQRAGWLARAACTPSSRTIYSLPTVRVSSEVAHEVLLRLDVFTHGAIPKGLEHLACHARPTD
jgi:hypothetical protein